MIADPKIEDSPNHWLLFWQCFNSSIAQIPEKYFSIERHEAPPIIRERAYCYELYHQLRCNLGDSFPYALHGEIDKRGHDFVTRHFKNEPNPDFVVHVPGLMDNLIVIEVKVSNCFLKDVEYDCQKISTFLHRIKYQYGIFLLFGPHDPASLMTGLGSVDQRILVLWHKEVGEHPEVMSPGEN